MADIDYYFSLISPFTYLASDRLERVAKARGASVSYRPVDFAEVGGATGWTPPAKRHPSRIEYRRQDLLRLARRESMAFNIQPAHWPTDTLPASRTVIAAALAGLEPGPLARGFLRSVWALERDIADPETVAAVVEETGYASDALAPHIEESERLYRRYTAEAPERGAFGAPFYIVGDERFWGQDRLPDLDRHLSK